MKKILFTTLIAVLMIVAGAGVSHSYSSYLTAFNNTYGTSGTVLNTCTVCHTSSSGGSRNAYGNAFGAVSTHSSNPSGALTSIQNADSDGDGFTNIVEINARTFPGSATSHPTTADTTPPTVTTFSIPSTSSSMTVPIMSIGATDNVGVTGYIVTTSATAPSATAAGWTASPPASYTFTSAGLNTLYAYAKDTANNISSGKSASVTITISTAPQPPSGNVMLMPPATSGLVWDDTYKRLGVGTVNPGLTLDIIGAHVSGTGMARFTGSDKYGFMTTDTTANGPDDESGFLVKLGGTLTGQFGARKGDNAVYIKNRVYGMADIITIASTGNVGIGTTIPTQTLEVSGGIRINPDTFKPVCDSNARGTFWFTQGTTNDKVEVCALVNGSLAWKALW